MYIVEHFLCVLESCYPNYFARAINCLIKNVSTLFKNEFITNFIVTKYFELKQKI